MAWIGLTESGEPVKRIEIPMGLEVLDLCDSRVIVRGRGSLGEHVVEVYSMEPRATR